MEKSDIDPFVKFPYFHKEQQKAFKNNVFIARNLFYNAEKACFVCLLKCLCHKAQGNRKIEVNHHLTRHKEKVRKLLTSEEDLYHRSKRPIEPESVFGQVKSNKPYDRFRHFNNDNKLIMMDVAIFAIAFDLGRMHNKVKITPKNDKTVSQNAQK
jgi:hypothetical protein